MSDTKLNEMPLFTLNYVNKLFRDLDKSEYLEYYKEGKFPFDENYPKGGSGIYLRDDFDLNPEASDFENSKILFENIQINETQASDKRLWTYLTHVHFWDYMKVKWKINFHKEEKNTIAYIKDRYFLNTLNIRSLTHNGISRLWWYSYLTIDESRKDKYELTKVLLSLQDIPVSLLERSMGSSKNVRRAILEFILENPEIKNGKKIQELMKQLNLAGGVKNIPMLKLAEIKSILEIIKSGL